MAVYFAIPLSTILIISLGGLLYGRLMLELEYTSYSYPAFAKLLLHGLLGALVGFLLLASHEFKFYPASLTLHLLAALVVNAGLGAWLVLKVRVREMLPMWLKVSRLMMKMHHLDRTRLVKTIRTREDLKNLTLADTRVISGSLGPTWAQLLENIYPWAVVLMAALLPPEITLFFVSYLLTKLVVVMAGLRFGNKEKIFRSVQRGVGLMWLREIREQREERRRESPAPVLVTDK